MNSGNRRQASQACIGAVNPIDVRGMETSWRNAIHLLWAQPLTIECFGDGHAKGIWGDLTRRHSKLPLIRPKSLGAAIQPLKDKSQFDGGRFKQFRYLARKADRLGYVVRRIDQPWDYVDQIHEVNTSTAVRQDKPLTPDYFDKGMIENASRLPGPWFGVFDKDNILVAYTRSPIFGDAYLYSRILGHAKHLEDGVMYLLMRDSILSVAKIRDETGYPNWAMYDTFFGGSPGLQLFKRHCGFEATRVKWVWLDK